MEMEEWKRGTGQKSQKPPHNNAREKSEHFPTERWAISKSLCPIRQIKVNQAWNEAEEPGDKAPLSRLQIRTERERCIWSLAVKEASFSFHNSSLCIGLLSPVTDMRSSEGKDVHKMFLNMSLWKGFGAENSQCWSDVTSDKKTCWTLTPCNIIDLFVVFSAFFTYSLCSSGFIAVWFKIQMNFRLAKWHHATVRLSTTMPMSKTPQIRFWGGKKEEVLRQF